MTDDDIELDNGINVSEQNTDSMSAAAQLVMRMPVDDCASVFALIKLAVDPRSAKRVIRELRDAANACASASAQLAADRAEHDRTLAADRHELAEDRAKLREAQIALADQKEAKEDAQAERAKYIRDLIERYRFVGEEDDVRRGFRQAEFSILMKMRSAHGYASDASDGLDDIANKMAETVGRPAIRHDDTGIAFPEHTTITRAETAPEPTPGDATAVAARARPYRRRAQHVE